MIHPFVRQLSNVELCCVHGNQDCVFCLKVVMVTLILSISPYNHIVATQTRVYIAISILHTTISLKRLLLNGVVAHECTYVC